MFGEEVITVLCTQFNFDESDTFRGELGFMCKRKPGAIVAITFPKGGHGLVVILLAYGGHA